MAAASLLPLITAALERRQTVLYDNSFYINQKIYANKLLDMDFPQLDDPKTHDDLSQILQNEKWSGYGLGRVLDVETKLPMSVFGVLGVVALTVTLFTQRVPESAGAWTVLNHPLFLLGCLLLLALLSVLPSLCMNRASMLTAELAPLARLGNRFFNFFAVMAISDRDRASDIRMYNQQDICESYASSDTPFSTNGPFAKLAWGRGGVLMIVSALFSVLFTVAAYLFVCLKALAGAFGAGSVVQYVSALTRPFRPSLAARRIRRRRAQQRAVSAGALRLPRYAERDVSGLAHDREALRPKVRDRVPRCFLPLPRHGELGAAPSVGEV